MISYKIFSIEPHRRREGRIATAGTSNKDEGFCKFGESLPLVSFIQRAVFVGGGWSMLGHLILGNPYVRH